MEMSEVYCTSDGNGRYKMIRKADKKTYIIVFLLIVIVVQS